MDGHYVGEVMRPQSLLSRLFRYVGDGSLEWADMGEVDRIRFGDEILTLFGGVRHGSINEDVFSG